LASARPKKVPSKPILILASAADDSARALAQRWASSGARLLLPRDLLHGGWQYHLGRANDSVTVVDGERFRASELAGVLTCLTTIFPQELVEVVSEDRSYIAAEINAFLVAWLAALPIPVLNRATPACLSGPNWRHEQWVHAASKVGIPVTPARRSIPGISYSPSTASSNSPIIITVVGKNCIGPPDSVLHAFARRLAIASSTELLSVHFSARGRHATFLSASTVPDVASKEVEGAILEHFARGSRKRAGGSGTR
jgi:hypothetical protein